VASPYDIVVIGGGITGLGIARLAARNRYRCALLERGDLASGTSSASSHMLHGGLRYLEHGRFGLVRESLAERRAVSRMASRLVEPRRFLLPLYRGDRVAPWMLHVGLTAYDWLAGPHGFSPHVMIGRADALALEPELAKDGLRGAGVYTDVVMDDARLAVAVARDAAAQGAEICTYTEVQGARPGEGGTTDVVTGDRLEGASRVFSARVVINAAGPWADHVRLTLSRALAPGRPDPEPLLRPSRGVHLVYPCLTRHPLALVARSDGRVFFVVPFGEHSLVGTTELEVPSPPTAQAWRASLEEVRYLRRELGRALPLAALTAPVAVLSGLRPLLRSRDEVGQASREHRGVDEDGVLTVAGGKYTTFRVMARAALEQVARRFGVTGRPILDPTDPLPAPLGPDADLERMAAFAVEHEFARRAEDVLRRRTLLWLSPDRGRSAAPIVAAAMGQRLGWSAERTQEEARRYEAMLGEEDSLLQRTGEVP
jgi:glycerol-3-phosphate dehydrogenase